MRRSGSHNFHSSHGQPGHPQGMVAVGVEQAMQVSGAGHSAQQTRPSDVAWRSKNRRKPRSIATTPLYAAAESGDFNSAVKLLDSGQCVNATCQAWTPLMKAAEEGHTELIQLLLSRRASLIASNGKGRDALSFAMAPSARRTPCTAAIKLLLQAKADPDHKDYRGETARARALRNENDESVADIDQYLLAANEVTSSILPSLPPSLEGEASDQLHSMLMS